MVHHVIDRVLKPGGRLIVLVGNEETESRKAEAMMTSDRVRVGGRIEVPHPGDDRLQRRLFWIDTRSE
jgi:predicted methyltransferase